MAVRAAKKELSHGTILFYRIFLIISEICAIRDRRIADSNSPKEFDEGELFLSRCDRI